MTDTLREKALKATQLEWEVGDRWVFVPPEDAANHPHHALRNVFKDVPEAQDNCEYVVAAQPTAILSLLDKYDAALAEIATLREALTSARTELFAEFGTTDDFVDTVVAKIDAALTSETPA